MGKKKKRLVEEATAPVWSPTAPRSPASDFAPHAFSKTMKIMGSIAIPHVVISDLAAQKMWHLVDFNDLEVGWLGSTHRDGTAFHIDDIFVFHQEVSAAETDMSPKGLLEVANRLLAQPDGTEVLESLRFWGHSHVKMGTSPSSQDQRQMDDFMGNLDIDWFIRGILNKLGRMEFNVYLYRAGLVFEDVEWRIDRADRRNTPIRQQIEQECNELVRPKTYGFRNQYGFHGQWDEDDWGQGAVTITTPKPINLGQGFGEKIEISGQLLVCNGQDFVSIDEFKKSHPNTVPTLTPIPDTTFSSMLRKINDGDVIAVQGGLLAVWDAESSDFLTPTDWNKRPGVVKVWQNAIPVISFPMTRLRLNELKTLLIAEHAKNKLVAGNHVEVNP